MNWLLDADVISQPAKKAGDARVIRWLGENKDDCYTSSIVIAQLAFWVRTKQGKQREALQSWLTRLTDAMQGRVLGFSVSVAHVWAEQQSRLHRAGKRMPIEHS
jgi:predicted nucleic acid-binding protein